jgi:hypothetical protein
MEEDYKVYSQEQVKQMDKLGINYVWRDSCVDILLELRQCMVNDYLSYFYILDSLSVCKGIQKLWKDCQYNRETRLQDIYFTAYEKKQKELFKNNPSQSTLKH